MAKRLSNLIDASLPPPPSVVEFVDALRNGHSARSEVDPVHGICPSMKQASGSEKTDNAAVRAFLEFIILCDLMQAVCVLGPIVCGVGTLGHSPK